MKRKLKLRNKRRFTKYFRQQKASTLTPIFDVSSITFDSISKSKLLGQRCYQQRLARQQKMNQRQLKKLRKRQRESGTIGSKLGGFCKVPLKPASGILIKK